MAFKNFLKGYGSVLELFPIREEEPLSKITSVTDEEALRQDWEAVGKDILYAIEECNGKISK